MCINAKHIGDRSWRNRTSRFLSAGYLESDGRCGGGLCHYFVFLCHAYVSAIAQNIKSSYVVVRQTLVRSKCCFLNFVESLGNKTKLFRQGFILVEIIHPFMQHNINEELYLCF